MDEVTRTRPVVLVVGLAAVSAVAAALAVLLAGSDGTATRADPSTGAEEATAPTTAPGGVDPRSIPAPAAPRSEGTVATEAEEADGSPVAWWAAGAAALAVATTAGAFVLGRRSAPASGGASADLAVRPVPFGAALPARATPAVRDTADALDPHVDELVDGLIAAHDLATDPTVRASVEQTLRSAGTTPVAPEVGDPFDPSRHEVVGVRPSSAPDDAGRVAGVVRAGWSGRGGLIRPAQVLVHRTA